jgi:hypothetical protein
LGGAPMLTIDLGTLEYYDTDKNEFVYETGGLVRFEYSLKAVYEWEAKWKKPFLKSELTYIEMIDLYKLMALDEFDDKFLKPEVAKLISDYIASSNTATTFSDSGGANGQTQGKKIHTSEEIYAMMFSAGIPLDFENRNLNRLLTILRIISIQNNPPKKMTREEVLKQNAELNRQRKAQMKTNG